MSCKKKTIKWATKLHIKEEGKGRKRASKKIVIDSPKNQQVQILTYAHAGKLKNNNIYIRLVWKTRSFCCKTHFQPFSCQLAENSPKTEEKVKNAGVSLLTGCHQGLKKVNNLFQIGLFPYTRGSLSIDIHIRNQSIETINLSIIIAG